MKTPLHFSSLLLLVALTALTSQVNAQSKNWIVLTADKLPLTVNGVDELSDGSFILTGKVYRQGDNSYSSGDFVISKMTADGNVCWSKKINSTYGYSFNGIHHMGNSVILDVIRSGSNMNEQFEQLIKMDTSGKTLATLSLNDNAMFYNESRFLDLPDGNIAFLRSLLNKIEVVCMDSDMNIIWTKDIIADAKCTRNPGLGICTDSSGNICVVGKSGNKLVLCMLSSKGDWLFGHRFESDGAYLRPYQVFSTGDGFVILGLFAKEFKLDVENSFVCKTDLKGKIEWTKILSDPDAENDFELSNGYKLADGNILIAGMAGGSNVVGEITESGNIAWTSMIGGTKYFTGSPASVGVNNILSVQNEDIEPYGNITSINSATIKSFLNQEVCNYFQKNALIDDFKMPHLKTEISVDDVLSVHPETSPADISLVNYAQDLQVQTRCTTIASTEEVKPVTPLYMLVYPNPATNDINIVMDGFDQHSEIKIFNLAAQQIFDLVIDSPPSNEFTFPVSRVPSGIYVAIYRGHDGQTISQKFVVQH